MTQHAEVTINFNNVVKQTGSYDCGLYSTAHVTALTHENDLVTHHYYRGKMKPHLRKCLLDRRLTLFLHKMVRPSNNFHMYTK